MIWTACLLGITLWSHPAPRANPFSATLGLSVIQRVAQVVVEANLLPVSGPEAVLSSPASALLEEEGASAKPAPEMTLCTLNVVNEDPAKILQILSAQTKTNLVLLAQSDKKITLNLKAVRLLDMIRHICALTGLKYLKVDQTFVLAGPDALKAAYPEEWETANPTAKPEPPAPAPPIVSSLIILNHISSSKLAPILEKVFEKGTLTIASGPSQDSPKVTSQNTNQATGASTSVLTSEGSENDLTAKMLVIRGPEPIVREAEQLARRLDVMRAQVVIQVFIYDILDSAVKELGLTWNFGEFAIGESQPDRLNFGTFQRSGLNFSSTIKALEKQDAAKILASPNISVLDGERAFILIGDRINYPVLVGYTNANTPIFSKEEERVGVYLQVAARVAGDDQITLSLYPQVSTVTGFLEVNGASYPQISTREAQSTLRVKSGDTLIMGGLLKNEEIRLVEKVPFLSDIPVLGELFKRRKSTKSASQVIMAIQPMLLRNDEP